MTTSKPSLNSHPTSIKRPKINSLVVRASAPFPGEGSMLAAELRLVDKGSRPPDRMLAPVCTALTALLAAGMALLAAKKKFSRS